MSSHNHGSSGPVFPADFLGGVATSAHQVEGGNHNNQWAQWEANGNIISGDKAGAACDWWNNAESDFDLAQQLGANALRLSIEWSRLEPSPGVWDQAALERYRSILKALHLRGLRPFVTLHHFTNPIWFEQQCAFASPDSVQLFDRFVNFVVQNLGDLCSDWVTFNEPNVYTALGYHVGSFPPGKKGHLFAGARVTRHLCLAHAEAYRTIHKLQPEARVGWAQHFLVLAPQNASSWFDRAICKIHDRMFNHNFAEGIEKGRAPFPASLWSRLAEVKNTCDFVGINYYNRLHVEFALRKPATFFGRLSIPDHLPQGDCGVELPYGEAYPAGLTAAVHRFKSLGKPIYILENGVPDREDRIRPWLLRSVFEQMQSLLRSGVDLRGYFHWTLTDNFEWNEGWHLRFGLYQLDPQSQQRVARGSAQIYKEIISSTR